MKKIYHTIRFWLAIKIEWLSPHLLNNNEQEKLSILKLRASLLFFGLNTKDMSNDEIKQGVNDLSDCLAKTSCSFHELVEISNRLAEV